LWNVTVPFWYTFCLFCPRAGLAHYCDFPLFQTTAKISGESLRPRLKQRDRKNIRALSPTGKVRIRAIDLNVS
jgi:hypothetical protein